MKRIPVTIVTGFLGSGKTTLLNRALRAPAFARAAVVVNEFGAIGIDHDLVERSDDAVVLLENGCLCCGVKGDLVTALGRLFERGGGAAFDRVVVETSGLAEPGPIADLLGAVPSLRSRYVLAGIVTTVDAVNGAATLEAHDSALRQVALADRIVITKADMLPPGVRAAEVDALTRRLSALNPSADCRMSGADDAESFLRAFAEPESSRAPAAAFDRRFRHAAHGAGRVRHASIVRDEPLDPQAVELFLQALERAAGPKLLRVKGILNVAGRPDGPAVLNCAQQLVHRVAWLDRWPGTDRRSRLVVLAMDMPGEEIAELLDSAERLARRAGDARRRAAASTAQDPMGRVADVESARGPVLPD